MQGDIRAIRHPFDPHLTRDGMKKREEFSRALPNLFMRLTNGVLCRLPRLASIGHRLVGTRFIVECLSPRPPYRLAQ